MIEYLLEKLSAECAEELKIVLQTPPDQQTQDQLSDSCRSQVQRKVGEYQKKLKKEQGGSDAEEGEGNGEKAARPRRAAPTVKPSTSKKAKKAAPSSIVKFFKSISIVSIIDHRLTAYVETGVKQHRTSCFYIPTF